MRPYTTFSPNLNHYMKQNKVSANELLSFMTEKLEHASSRESFDEIAILINAFQIDKSIMDQTAMHLFMPPLEFCEWIVRCTTSLEYDHFKLISDMVHGGAGCLHFEAKDNLHSIGFWIPEKGYSIVEQDLVEEHSYEMLVLSFPKGSKEGKVGCAVRLHSMVSHSDIVLWYARLISGLGMYLSCFPQQIEDGIPKDLKHPNHFKNIKARTISINEKVILRDGPIPHYRMGHFRFLESERYKNKRGKTVFVHGCFVKGKAETILPE